MFLLALTFPCDAVDVCVWIWPGLQYRVFFVFEKLSCDVSGCEFCPFAFCFSLSPLVVAICCRGRWASVPREIDPRIASSDPVKMTSCVIRTSRQRFFCCKLPFFRFHGVQNLSARKPVPLWDLFLIVSHCKNTYWYSLWSMHLHCFYIGLKKRRPLISREISFNLKINTKV